MLSVALALGAAVLAFLRFAQDQNPADLSLLGGVLLVALPGVASLISTFLYGGLKTILPFYDKLPAQFHMIAAPVLSFLFGFYVVGKLHLPGVTDVGGLNLDWFMGAATTLGTAGIFRFFKRKSPVDATVALEAGRASTGTGSGGLR